ncbi:TIGR00282 family metallophosphoesterase [Pelagibacterales bacterium SAG-MED32]|nr:TIGR00282 family metallophosphoesterase [Pelagibacterales bacterium SAG-MED32]
MKILFLGDVMGMSGRHSLRDHLPQAITDNNIDFVIANGENAAGGFGITESICNELYSYGVNVITTGNHLWDQKEITNYIDKDQNLLKPYNFAEGSPGLGFNIYELGNKEKIAVINIMGNLFMRSCDNAFFKIEEALQKIDVKDLSFIFVDFHAEASSEKMAMGHHLDGRVTAVVGTHTHVPTADATIMEHGTAYQTDAGMCGDYDSVIGTKKQEFVRKFATQDTERKRVPPADGVGTLCGVIIESQHDNFLAKNIQSIRIGGKIGN